MKNRYLAVGSKLAAAGSDSTLPSTLAPKSPNLKVNLRAQRAQVGGGRVGPVQRAHLGAARAAAVERRDPQRGPGVAAVVLGQPEHVQVELVADLVDVAALRGDLAVGDDAEAVVVGAVVALVEGGVGRQVGGAVQAAEVEGVGPDAVDRDVLGQGRVVGAPGWRSRPALTADPAEAEIWATTVKVTVAPGEQADRGVDVARAAGGGDAGAGGRPPRSRCRW